MKQYLVILSIGLAGCTSMDKALDSYLANIPCPGTRSYDPQICRGEKPARLPNFTNEAQDIMRRCGSIGADCPGPLK